MDKETSIPFDQYQRYGVAARVIEALRKNGEQLNILEVGANTHKLLGRLLPNDRIVYLDREIPLEMQGQDDIIVCDATELTLPDASFDVVVALDVFEHIPTANREAFLHHTCRIARLLTIIGAPFDSPFVVQAEREASDFWDSLFDHPYRWLVEHAENGLPNFELTTQIVTSLGYNLHTLRHGDIKLWTAFIKGHFAEVCVGSLQPVLSVLYKYYQDHLFENDFSPSESYRQFIFCSRDSTITQGIKNSLIKRPSAVDGEADSEFPIQILNLLPSIAIEKAGLTQAAAERDGQIASLSQAVAERDGQIASLSQAVAERDGQIASLSQAAAERDGQIASLSQAVAERDGQIAALYSSTSWGITRPLRIVAHQMKRVRRVAELTMPAIRRGGGLKNTFKKAMQLYRREGMAGIRRGFRIIATFGQMNPSPSSGEYDRNDYAEWIRRYDTITDKSLTTMRERIDAFVHKPLISVVMPVYNPPLIMLEEAIRSVQGQLYPNWELCIADDASTDVGVHKLLQRYADNDPRIKVVYRKKNGHISAASNSALELAKGEYVALLDNDDLLSEQTLFWVADAIVTHPDVGLIYSDEDKIDQSGRRFDPNFKPDWNPDLFLSHNMISHLGTYRTDLVRKLGGFREGYEGAQDYDLALRCTEQLAPRQILHIPRVLYHWRSHAGSTAQAGSEKNYALLAGERVLNDHFARTHVSAKAELLDFGMYRARYTIPTPAPLVSLIIPTRNGLDLIKQCIESIIAKTTFKNYEILILDNNSDDPKALAYFASLAENNRIRILRDERPFNYSALNNDAVIEARGEYLGLINNDIEVISPEWLSEMMGLAIQSGVGAVGARLWYPNDTLQHGGCITGIGGVAGHSHKNLPRGSVGYFARAQLIQTLSVVTAACLVIKKSIYLEVGGLDETNLKVAFNDVDFCLRVQEAGYRNVWTPYAELYHHESATRGYEDTLEKQLRFRDEVLYMQKRWGALLKNDPAYNPNLTLECEDFSYAWPPRVEAVPMTPQDTQKTH